MTRMETLRHDELAVRRIGIDTYREPVVFMRADSVVCRSEGFRALSRVRVSLGERTLIATLNVVHGELVSAREIGLSEAAWHGLAATEGVIVNVSHPEMSESFASVRSKIYGSPFTQAQLDAVVRDISSGRYSTIETASFVTACAGASMSLEETIALTRAMVAAGTRLSWPQPAVMDKHCVGGLPGNRTTPIVVAIAAACGLTIPKTSSRAITSPAGTADTMEVTAPVDLTIEQMRRVVESEGGCIIWGGSMALSPADDILIQVERPLDFDSDGQLAASIISKKVAAGSTHVVIDVPVGPTAKVRSFAAARALAARLTEVGKALGLHVDVTQTDGSVPIGRGIGPALEAHDVLAVLRKEKQAPHDLRERACVSTMHANNANQAIERIINFFPDQAHKQLYMDLSLNLKGVVSQRLIPATDGKQALATEMLLLSPYVSDLIQKGRVDEIKDAMAKSNDFGMHTFDQSLFFLYKHGRISLEEALRNADSHTDLSLRIRLSDPHSSAEAPLLTVRSDPSARARQAA